MFFHSWAGLGRLLAVGLLAYPILILWLRISGKRTLSKWNAFDLVVTIALGSTLATVLMSKDVTLVEGALAFALLIAFQFGITWLSVRFSVVPASRKTSARRESAQTSFQCSASIRFSAAHCCLRTPSPANRQSWCSVTGCGSDVSAGNRV